MSTNWLDEKEQRAWRAYIEATTLLLDALDRDMQTHAGIPHAYYMILIRLDEAADHSLRMSELATLTRSSRSRLSHAVARLEDRGWINRSECETDRRGQVATLTSSGQEALAAAAPAHVQAVRSYLIDRLTADDLDALTRIGTAVIAGLSD